MNAELKERCAAAYKLIKQGAKVTKTLKDSSISSSQYYVWRGENKIAPQKTHGTRKGTAKKKAVTPFYMDLQTAPAQTADASVTVIRCPLASLRTVLKELQP